MHSKVPNGTTRGMRTVKALCYGGPTGSKPDTVQNTKQAKIERESAQKSRDPSQIRKASIAVYSGNPSAS
jgi:hypothetical protein